MDDSFEVLLMAKIRTVTRSEWNLVSLQNPNRLIREGSEQVGRCKFVRFVRWNPKLKAYQLDALVRWRSKLYYQLIKDA